RILAALPPHRDAGRIANLGPDRAEPNRQPLTPPIVTFDYTWLLLFLLVSALGWQFGLLPEWRPALISHSQSLPELLTFQRLPSLHQPEPKRPIAVVTSNGREAATFIGAPPKLFYTHFHPPCRPFPPSPAGRLKNCF